MSEPVKFPIPANELDDEITSPTWDEMRAAGLVVFDYPAHKCAIYPSASYAQVVIKEELDGEAVHLHMETGDVPKFMALLAQAHADAVREECRLDSEVAGLEKTSTATRAPDA